MKSTWGICFKVFLKQFLTVFRDSLGCLCTQLTLDKVVVLDLHSECKTALNLICSETLLIESKKIMARDSAPICSVSGKCSLKCTCSSQFSGLLIQWC